MWDPHVIASKSSGDHLPHLKGGKPIGKWITNKKRLVSHGLLSLSTSHPSTTTASKYPSKSHIFLLQRKKTKSRTVIIKKTRFYCLKADCAALRSVGFSCSATMAPSCGNGELICATCLKFLFRVIKLCIYLELAVTFLIAIMLTRNSYPMSTFTCLDILGPH